VEGKQTERFWKKTATITIVEFGSLKKGYRGKEEKG